MKSGPLVAKAEKKALGKKKDLELLKEDLNTFGWDIEETEDGTLKLFRPERAREIRREV